MSTQSTQVANRNGRAPERVSGSKKGSLLPRADVYENAAELLVVFDVPGAVKDKIDVRVEQHELVVEAPREAGRVYQRVFKLPEGIIDEEGVAADLEAGVLRVHLPKSAGKKARRIEIKGA